MRFPSDASIVHSEAAVSLEFRLDPDLIWFQGHFPDYPILAGIGQLDILFHFATAFELLPAPVQAIEFVKFQRPLFPGNAVRLVIERDAAKGRVEFTFSVKQDDQWIQASIGRISLSKNREPAISQD